jgi:hypothetical protein
MPEPKNYSFAHTEIAEILIKQANIHEGHWGVYFEFGLAAANVPTTPDGKTFAPAAINFVNKIGIQRFDAPTNLTVDAAKANPLPMSGKKRPGRAS